MLYAFSTNLVKLKKAWPARIPYNDFYRGTEGVGFTKWSGVESVPTYYRGISPTTTDEFASLKFDFIDVSMNISKLEVGVTWKYLSWQNNLKTLRYEKL